MVVEAVVGKRKFFIAPSIEWLKFVMILGELELESYNLPLVGGVISTEHVSLLEADAKEALLTGDIDQRLVDNLVVALDAAYDCEKPVVIR